jgi:hypothetical protein
VDPGGNERSAYPMVFTYCELPSLPYRDPGPPTERLLYIDLAVLESSNFCESTQLTAGQSHNDDLKRIRSKEAAFSLEYRILAA